MANVKGRDMGYELTLFKKFLGAQVNGVPLSQLYIHSNVPIWQRFHQTAFASDIKQFSESYSYEIYAKKINTQKKQYLKSALLFLFITFLTVGGISTLLLGRQKVLVFSVDKVSDHETKCDFRISKIYKILRNNSIPFVECFHAFIDNRVILNFFARKRFGVYLEAFDGLWYVYRFFARPFKQAPVFEITNVKGTKDEVQFIKRTIKKYLATRGLLEFRTKVLKILLRLSNVQVVVGIDDVRHYQELMEAAHQLNIKTIAVQHGHFTKYHLGWLGSDEYGNVRYQKADKIFVWSEYWKNELLRLGSVYAGDEIVVAGYPYTKFDTVFREKIHKRTVLIPHETEAPKEEVLAFIKALNKCKGVEIYLKVRPDVPVKEQLKAYPEDVKQFTHVVKEITEVPRPDVVVGVYSTFLYDMVLLGIPTLIMQTSMDYGEGMLINGMASSLSLEDICDEVKQAAASVSNVLDERIQKLDSDKDFTSVLLEDLKAARVV